MDQSCERDCQRSCQKGCQVQNYLTGFSDWSQKADQRSEREREFTRSAIFSHCDITTSINALGATRQDQPRVSERSAWSSHPRRTFARNNCELWTGSGNWKVCTANTYVGTWKTNTNRDNVTTRKGNVRTWRKCAAHGSRWSSFSKTSRYSTVFCFS